MTTNRKNLVAVMFLKRGQLVRDFNDYECLGDIPKIIDKLNNNGIDKIIIFDLSDDDNEHEINLHAYKEINRICEKPVYGGGNVKRMEDVKKLLYAGCKKVILNGRKKNLKDVAEECSARFGKDKLAISIDSLDVLFKSKQVVEDNLSEIIVLQSKVAFGLDGLTELPFSICLKEIETDKIANCFNKLEGIKGIGNKFTSDPDSDIHELKSNLEAQGVSVGRFDNMIQWEELKKGPDGLVPVIVQDYKTNEVLMMAYMNEDAYNTTLSGGKMCYYSRSRQEQWLKGDTSGHFQYVKTLQTDCDKDTILAKVSQVGAACHTGSRSCFFNDIITEKYEEKNLIKVIEDEYDVIIDRKENPKEGSYTNYLLDKGIDKILKKMGEEATEIVIAAKNPDSEEIKYEIADFLYHMMVMMVVKGITWDEVLDELSKR